MYCHDLRRLFYWEIKVLLSNLLSYVIVDAGYFVGNTYLRKKSICENEGHIEQQQAGRDDPDMLKPAVPLTFSFTMYIK